MILDKKELIDEEIEFASTINEELLDNLKGWEFDQCPICGRYLWPNRKSKEGHERKLNTTHSDTILTKMVYLKCPHCSVSYTRYNSLQAPIYRITSALLMVIVFTPHVDYYQLKCKFGLNVYTVRSARERFKVLIDLMIGFKEMYHPKDFEQFMDYYEDKKKFDAYQKQVNIELPTRENANPWIYKYIVIKNKCH